MKDKSGTKVPFVNFQMRDDYKWVTKTTDDLFKNKKVVLFALPGAFTPTCSSVHLPAYNDLYPVFKKNGIDDVICLSVNDSFVLNEWKIKEGAKNITMLPDGNGEFTKKLGFLVDKKDLCFGNRSRRYSMLVNDGLIEKMFLEPDVGGDPYGESSAEKMLNYLNPKEKLPPSITIFTKAGSVFCARAKELLKKNQLDYDELVLNEEFSLKTIKAISNATKLPQIFIDGTRIGGADDLESYFNQKKNISA